MHVPNIAFSLDWLQLAREPEGRRDANTDSSILVFGHPCPAGYVLCNGTIRSAVRAVGRNPHNAL